MTMHVPAITRAARRRRNDRMEAAINGALSCADTCDLGAFEVLLEAARRRATHMEREAAVIGCMLAIHCTWRDEDAEAREEALDWVSSAADDARAGLELKTLEE
jgi:hypothetical protein